MFAGIAGTSDVTAYLNGVPHGRFDESRGMAHASMMRARPPMSPMRGDIWAASASGTGELTMHWGPRPGEWSLVVMNADARPEVRADVSLGATAPHLHAVAIGLLAGGVAALVVGPVVIVLAFRRSSSR